MFHASRTDLAVGYIVQPFNLPGRVPNALAIFADALATGAESAYRMLRAFNEGQSAQGPAFIIEARAEQIRASEFLDRPRRWDCLFAFRTLAEALNFGTAYGRPHVFKIEPIDDPPAVWCGDFAVFTPGPDVNAEPAAGLQALDARLRTYWQTMTQDLDAAAAGWELLIRGTARVTSACLAP